MFSMQTLATTFWEWLVQGDKAFIVFKRRKHIALSKGYATDMHK